MEIAGKISRSQNSSYEKEPKSKIFHIINDMNPVYTLANYLICVPVDLFEVLVVILIMFRIHCGLGIIALLMTPLYLISSYLNKDKLEQLVSRERKNLDNWQREVDIILNHKVSIGLNHSWNYMLERYKNGNCSGLLFLTHRFFVKTEKIIFLFCLEISMFVDNSGSYLYMKP